MHGFKSEVVHYIMKLNRLKTDLSLSIFDLGVVNVGMVRRQFDINTAFDWKPM